MRATARIGVIGAGWWACFHSMPELQKIPTAKLVAVCRLEAPELEKVKLKFGFEHAFEDYQRLLNEVELDGVVVASPHVDHFAHASAALEHNLHVLVEKPMCTNAADARALEELAKKHDRQVIVPCGWNFKSSTREAKRLIANGSVGKIEHMIIQMASPLDDLFAGEEMLESIDHFYQPPVSTWADPERAGGYAWGQLSHAVTLALHISCLQPQQVSAVMVNSAAGVDYYDAATVQFSNGASATISGAATMPKDKGFKLEVRVFGSEGLLIFDIEHERLEVWRRDGNHVSNSMQPGEGAYTCVEPYEQLIAYCLGESPINDSPVSCGRKSVEIIDAMHRSAASGEAQQV